MIEPTFNLYTYHWIWYFIGFLFAPRLTVMIFLTIYFSHAIPPALMVCGWVFGAAMNCFEVKLYNKGK